MTLNSDLSCGSPTHSPSQKASFQSRSFLSLHSIDHPLQRRSFYGNGLVFFISQFTTLCKPKNSKGSNSELYQDLESGKIESEILTPHKPSMYTDSCRSRSAGQYGSDPYHFVELADLCFHSPLVPPPELFAFLLDSLSSTGFQMRNFHVEKRMPRSIQQEASKYLRASRVHTLYDPRSPARNTKKLISSDCEWTDAQQQDIAKFLSPLFSSSMILSFFEIPRNYLLEHTFCSIAYYFTDPS